jgi:hypothetical protein
MDQALSSRLALLECVAKKSELDLARQRQLIEDLRSDGHRTGEAEVVLQRFEGAYAALVAKLEALRNGQPASSVGGRAPGGRARYHAA